MNDWILILALALMFLTAATAIGFAAFVVRKSLAQNRELVKLALIEQTKQADQAVTVMERIKVREERTKKRDRWDPESPGADEDAGFNAVTKSN